VPDVDEDAPTGGRRARRPAFGFTRRTEFQEQRDDFAQVRSSACDMEDANVTQPELADATRTTTAVIHDVVPMAEIADFFDRSFSELATVLDEQGIAATGAAFARYAGPPGETADLEVGFPIDGSVSPKGGVHSGSLPAGRVARLVHVGGYDKLGESWAYLGTWIVEQGLTPGTDLWEVYVTEPNPDMDPADLRTELFWTVR
jgi:effector-binding domain-containing protein